MFKVSSQKMFQMQDVVINVHQVMKPDEVLSVSKFPHETTHAYVRAFKELFVHHVKLINSINLTTSELELPDFEKVEEFSPSLDLHGAIDEPFGGVKSKNPSFETLNEQPKSHPSKETIPANELYGKEGGQDQPINETRKTIQPQFTIQVIKPDENAPGGLFPPIAESEQISQ